MKKSALILAIALIFTLLVSCTPKSNEEEKQNEEVKNEEASTPSEIPDETIGETPDEAVNPEDEFPWEGDPVETPIIDPNGNILEIVPDENELPAIPIE